MLAKFEITFAWATSINDLCLICNQSLKRTGGVKVEFDPIHTGGYCVACVERLAEAATTGFKLPP
jgi:hypothetical protein